MTPLRLEDITLLCEDPSKGRSQRLLNAALEALLDDLPFAFEVAPTGMASKNDVQVRAKFARKEGFRVFAIRDRDFLQRPRVEESRRRSFDKLAEQVLPWPLSRHCIESYLLDDDVLGAAVPRVTPEALRVMVDQVAGERQWLDVARGTLEDLAWRLRRVRQQAIDGRPTDRGSAVDTVRQRAGLLGQELDAASADESLTAFLDALAADMTSDGPLRHRVDGRELVVEVERALATLHAEAVPAGGLLAAVDRQACKRPPAALVADLRAVLEAVPASWRST